MFQKQLFSALLVMQFLVSPILGDIMDPAQVREDLKIFIPRCSNVAHSWIRALLHESASGGMDGSLQYVV